MWIKVTSILIYLTWKAAVMVLKDEEEKADSGTDSNAQDSEESS